MRETSTFVTLVKHTKLSLIFIKGRVILRQTSAGVGYCYVQRIVSNVILGSLYQVTLAIVEVSCMNTNREHFPSYDYHTTIKERGILRQAICRCWLFLCI